jgi:capsular polysaccharide biosynthesis protein
VNSYPLAGQKTTLRPAATIKSPSFSTHYPQIRNVGLVRNGPKAAMEVSWNRGLFPERDIEIFQIKGAYFWNECLILDDDLRVIENASDAYTEDEISRAIIDIKNGLAAQRLPHFVGPGIVTGRRAIGNYGHFLMEMLPMAVTGREFCEGKEPLYLVHRVGPALVDVILRSFRLLGVRLDHIRMSGAGEPMHFEELVIVRGLTAHGTYMSPLCVNAVASLAQNIVPQDRKKLFIKRVPGWKRGRVLLNEEEVSLRLSSEGYLPIEPSGLTFEQQMALFRGADHVVGVSGAAMTNIVFCRPGTRITNLVPGNFPDTFFWFIAAHKELSYEELRGEPAGDDPSDLSANFSVSEDDIKWLMTLASDEHNEVGGEVIAHFHETGDLRCSFGEWVGTTGSGQSMEGFAIKLPAEVGSIEYRAVIGRDWLSPWVADGVFCGSRGMDLPIYGLTFRLKESPDNAPRLTCHATFVDGTRRDNIAAGHVCVAESLAPLEAFQIVMRNSAAR